jgi:hypothetical protein
MNKDITNINLKNQYHGYQEWYWNNKLSYRGNWNNNLRIGYVEHHLIKQTRYYII